MKSHTVPKKLLEQFAYANPVTRSKRLWRYQKGQPPYGRASPKRATRRDRHFADPANSAKEGEIEQRLKREFEDPVNQFIDLIGYRSFALTPAHIRLLTGYITILFNRTRARRAASDGQTDVMIEALRALLSDDERLSQLAANHTMNMINGGYPLRRMVTKQEIVEGIESTIAEHVNDDEPQRRYVQTIETMMGFGDEKMLNGHWGVIHAEPDKPFVIGDAPVVTWERTENNILLFGQGFARPNVEAFLPVSPTACLHVLPLVERTRQVRVPGTEEVNMAQAAFATEHCFTNLCSPEIDASLQPHFGKVRLGIEGFSVGDVDYTKVLFGILMRQRVQPAASAT